MDMQAIVTYVVAVFMAATMYLTDYAGQIKGGLSSLAPLMANIFSGPATTISATAAPTLTLTKFLTTTVTDTTTAVATAAANSSSLPSENFSYSGVVVWEDLEPLVDGPAIIDPVLVYLLVAVLAGALLAVLGRLNFTKKPAAALKISPITSVQTVPVVSAAALSLSGIKSMETVPRIAAAAPLSFSSIWSVGIAAVEPIAPTFSFSAINIIETAAIAPIAPTLSTSVITTINAVEPMAIPAPILALSAINSIAITAVELAPAPTSTPTPTNGRILLPKPTATRSNVAKKVEDTLVSLREERDEALATTKQHAADISDLRKSLHEKHLGHELDVAKSCIKELKDGLKKTEKELKETKEQLKRERTKDVFEFAPKEKILEGNLGKKAFTFAGAKVMPTSEEEKEEKEFMFNVPVFGGEKKEEKDEKK